MTDPAAIRPLLAMYEGLFHDLHEAGGTLSRLQLINKINGALPRQYNPFLNHWKLTHYGTLITNDVFKIYKNLLFNYRDDNKDKWDVPKDKPPRTTYTFPPRTSHVPNNGPHKSNSLKCDHCGNVGYSIATCRYVGKPETPTCSFCKKLGHVEATCRKKARNNAPPTTASNADLALVSDNNDVFFSDNLERIIASAHDLSSFQDTSDFDCHDINCLSLNCMYDHPTPQISTDSSQNCGNLASVRGADYRVNKHTVGLDTVDSPNTYTFMATTPSAVPVSNRWICDSGASRHITNDSSLFSRLEYCTERIGACKQGSQLEITGKGDVEFVVTNRDGARLILQLSDVRYAPDARCNLLSISSFIHADPGYYTLTTRTDGMLLYREHDNKKIAHAPLHTSANVYVLSMTRSADLVAAAAVDFNDPVWSEHRRLGHLSLAYMRHLTKISDSMTVTDKQIQAKLKDQCPVCATTRALYRIPRDPADRHYENVGELVTVDTWGPYPVPGLKGERYALFLIDDATRFTWVSFFKAKGDIGQLLVNTFRRLSNEHGRPIVRLRCDNEFVQHTVTDYCHDHGITVETSAPYAHHHAGAAERSHRTVRERAAAMIQDFTPTSPMVQGIVNRNEEALRNATLPEGLWMFAMVESVNKKNRAPSKALRFLKTPYEALHGRRPNLTKDNAWGARVYVTFPPELAISRHVTKLHHPRGYLAHFLCALSDQICLVWRSDTQEVKRVTITRVDNSAGFDDVQPHGLHINNRVPLVAPPIPDAAYDSDSSTHSDLYNANVAFVSFNGTTDVFGNEIDWSNSPEPPRTYELADEADACGPCLRSNLRCMQLSDTDDDLCEACLHRNRDCNY
jgi:hypothetical protein